MSSPVSIHLNRVACLALTAAMSWSLTSSVCQGQSLDKQGAQWRPFLEWELAAEGVQGNPFDVEATATFVHEASGEKRTTGMFHDGKNRWKFRFTATRPGKWTFTTNSKVADLNGKRGTVTIAPRDDAYGFVTHVGNRWARPRGAKGELEAFVPQLVMYADPEWISQHPAEIDKDIQIFLTEHGFTGFHVPVLCRWFDIHKTSADEIDSDDPHPDPRTFVALESFITKVHAAGGVVHFWAWGDESRRQTPSKWGRNGRVDQRLQRYIAARLGPLPGWTMGYGFDLWEWVEGEELAAWHDYLHAHLGWSHMLGARASKNEFDQLSEELDYSSYEQHRPDYAKYVETLEKRPKKPSFSEDRFRIRDSQYREKDYDQTMTRRGLWHSTMAGGVANIWGNYKGVDFSGGGKSLPYLNAAELHTCSEFFRGRFALDMVRDSKLSDGYGLSNAERTRILVYREDAKSIRLDLSQLPGEQPAVAIDAQKAYKEIDLGRLQAKEQTWTAPYESDWAIAIGNFPERRSDQ